LTKKSLARSSVHTGVVIRERVMRRIADAARHRVVVLIAGAGYGKSEALFQYLRRLRKSKIVYRVPKHLATMQAFLQGFAESCAPFASGMAMSVDSACRASGDIDDPATALAGWAASHLSGFKGAIVIEDFDNCRASADAPASAFLHRFIEQQESIRWFITARRVGALPIASWIADRLSDVPISSIDLTFNSAEAMQLARTVGCPWELAEIDNVVSRWAGWPFPVAFEVRSSTRMDTPNFATTNAITSEYITSQVWSSLSINEQHFLECAAVIPRFSRSIAIRAGFNDAVSLGRSLCERLAFVSARDGFFGMHDLFRSFILERLESQGHASFVELLLKAALLLDSDGDLTGAIECALKTKDKPAIASFIEGRELALASLQHREISRRLIEALQGYSSESLSFISVICKFDDGEYLEAMKLGRALLLKETVREELMLPLLSVLARAAITLGVDVDEIPWPLDSEQPIRLLRDSARAFSFAARGSEVEAREAFSAVMGRDSEVAGNPLVLHLMTGTAIWLRLKEDALRYAKDSFEAAVQVGDEALAARCAANIAAAMANDGFDLEGVDLAVAQIRYYCERNGLWTVLRSALEGYGTQLACAGLECETKKVVDELKKLPRPLGAVALGPSVLFMELALCVMLGNLKVASNILEIIGRESRRARDIASRGWIAESYLLVAFCAAVSGDRALAIRAISDYEGLRMPQGMGNLMILHRQIAAEFALGRITRARRIARSIVKAHPATSMLDSCYAGLFGEGRSPVIRNALLAYRNNAGIGLLVRMLEILTAEKVRGEVDVSMTPTERDILRMLALELANKEIAVARSSSVATVKVHVRSILGKLGASGRMNAVAIARERGLL
jgi:DNA-binding CsgD family transcriptional regulator